MELNNFYAVGGSVTSSSPFAYVKLWNSDKTKLLYAVKNGRVGGSASAGNGITVSCNSDNTDITIKDSLATNTTVTNTALADSGKLMDSNTSQTINENIKESGSIIFSLSDFKEGTPISQYTPNGAAQSYAGGAFCRPNTTNGLYTTQSRTVSMGDMLIYKIHVGEDPNHTGLPGRAYLYGDYSVQVKVYASGGTLLKTLNETRTVGQASLLNDLDYEFRCKASFTGNTAQSVYAEITVRCNNSNVGTYYPIFTVESNHISLTATKTGTLITNGSPRVSIIISAPFIGIVNIKSYNSGSPLLNDTISFDSNGELITKTYLPGSPIYSTSAASFTKIVVTLTIPDITYLQTNNIIIDEIADRTVTTSESGGLTQIGKYNNAKIKGLYYNASQNISMPANWNNYTLSSSYSISYGKSADIYVIMDNESLTGQVEVSNKWDIIKADTIEETNINRDFPFYNSKWENGCCVSVPEINETGDFSSQNNSQITYTRDGDSNSLTANMFIEDTSTTPSVIYVPGNHVKRILYNQSTDGYVYAVPDYGYIIASSSSSSLSSAGIAGAQRTNSPITSATQTIGSTTIRTVKAFESGVKAPEVSSVTSKIYQTGSTTFQEVVTVTFKNPNSSGYYLKYKTSQYANDYTTTKIIDANGTTTVGFNAPTSSSTGSGTVKGSIIAFFANTSDDSYYRHSYLIHVSINGEKQSTTAGINAGRNVYIESSDVRENLLYTTVPYDITTFQPELSFRDGYMYLSNYADIPVNVRSSIYPVLVRHVHHKVGSSTNKIRHLWKYDNGAGKDNNPNALHLGLTIDWSDGKILTSNQVLESLLNGRKSYYSSPGATTDHNHQYIGLSLNYYVDPRTNTHSPESSTYIDLDKSTMTKTLVDHCVYKTV